MCASHSPTHDAASPRLLRHRKTQIRPYLQCVCGLARTANPGRSRMEIRPDASAPLHNYHLCISARSRSWQGAGPEMAQGADNLTKSTQATSSVRSTEPNWQTFLRAIDSVSG